MSQPPAASQLELLRAAIAESPEAVILFDSEKRVVATSRAAAPLLQLDPWQLCAGTLATSLPLPGAPLEAALRGQEADSAARPEAPAVRARPLRGARGEIVGAALWLSEPQQGGAEDPTRTFVTVVPTPVVVHRPDGEIVFANRAALELFRHGSLEELRRRSAFDLMHRDDRAAANARLEQALRAGKPAPIVEQRLVRGDGTVARAIVNGVPWHFDGAPAAFVFAVDLSELREAEAERERLLEQTRALAALRERILESIVEGVWVTDSAGRLLFANREGCRLLGAPDYASAPKTIAEAGAACEARTAGGRRFEPQELPLIRALQGQTVRTEALLAVRGARHHVEVLAAPLTGEDGAQLGAVAVVHDMTATKRAQRETEELRRLAERRAAEVESILFNIADAVVVCDEAGRLVLSNEPANRLLHVYEGAEGQLVSEFMGALRVRWPDGRALVPEELPLERVLSERTPTVDELVIAEADGQPLQLRTSASPIIDEQGELRGAVAVIRDVTELGELERLKDEFLAVAAHELKTPVTVVKGYAQAMRRTGEPLGGQTERLLSAIDRGAERIAAIVRDLIDVSQLRRGSMRLAPRPLDLAELLAQTVAALPPGTAARVRREGARQARILGDAEALSHAIHALLDNAARYSADDSPIDLELGLDEAEAVVTVRDRGIGIPAARQGRIFELFYRAHTDTPFDRGGMGVGLYVSQQIAEQHGGGLAFTSRESEGSSFVLRLPLADE